MKYKYRTINFKSTAPRIWTCYDNRSTDKLGVVKWFESWQKFVFSPVQNVALDDDRLDQLERFVSQVNVLFIGGKL